MASIRYGIILKNSMMFRLDIYHLFDFQGLILKK